MIVVNGKSFNIKIATVMMMVVTAVTIAAFAYWLYAIIP